MDWDSHTDHGGHTGGIQLVSLVCVSVLCGKWHMGGNRHTLERELFDRSECWSNSDLCGRFDIWMKKPLENMIFLKDTRCSIELEGVALDIVSFSKITRLTLLPSMLY